MFYDQLGHASSVYEAAFRQLNVMWLGRNFDSPHRLKESFARRV
jgi:hypothetical protein